MKIRLHITAIIVLAALLFLPASSRGQGFIQYYPYFTWFGGGPQNVFPQANGDFILTAVSTGDFVPTSDLLWLHTDPDGLFVDGDTVFGPISAINYFLTENGRYYSIEDIDSAHFTVVLQESSGTAVWSRVIDFPGAIDVGTFAVNGNAGGDFFVRGYVRESYQPPVQSGFVLKLSAAGDLLWKSFFEHEFGITFVAPENLLPTPDGGCILANETAAAPVLPYNTVIYRFDAAGNQVWNYEESFGQYASNRNGMAVNAGGELLAPVEIYDLSGALADTFDLVKLSPGGQPLWKINLSDSLNLNYQTLQLAVPLSDGSFVVAMQQFLLNSWYYWLTKIRPDGSIAWKKPLSVLAEFPPAKFADAQELPDGSLVFYGVQGDNLFLIKADAEGVVYPYAVTGTVQRDSTFNCLPDPADPGLAGWVVSAIGNNIIRYASTDASGRYDIADLPAGTYEVELNPPSYLWTACTGTFTVEFIVGGNLFDTVSFQVQAAANCPLLQVDIATPILRRCINNYYSVQYCNAGNVPAQDAYVTLDAEPLFGFVEASLPWTQQGDLVTVQLGTVQPGDCGNFTLTYLLSCDAVLGQTLCVDAHIYPDTICSTPAGWSGASIEVFATCEDDSVRFEIKNTGTGTSSNQLEYVIVDDHVITRQGLIPNLAPQESYIESWPADGSTWRIIADQEPGFPFGPRMPSLAVEGCTNNGNFSMGMVNLFSTFSGDPFEDSECRPVVGSYDPNDKQAFPTGAEAAHYIEQNQPLEYLIRFQNTGTDTAFTVVLKDTLSAWLDPATIRPGASSHAYTWDLSGAGILSFVFHPILLPDSNVNEAASHGFVRFFIDQQKDVPLSSIITNSAGIYFDFNAPVITNTVFHTVGHDFLPVATSDGPNVDNHLTIYPNPSADATWVLDRNTAGTPRTFVLRDVCGREVMRKKYSGEILELRRGNLEPGLYFLEIWANGHKTRVGKVVWQ